ncbi:Transcription factor 24 [Galemys pyrenaicus]|uniref:Transcription factor 24 n=1 Tax=Galemys pyrenaicus TaxID=202257 RepID=A0A8J6DLJ2_GALPY|nr:Transcription factor 24 [Galemys pyrenaicus]
MNRDGSTRTPLIASHESAPPATATEEASPGGTGPGLAGSGSCPRSGAGRPAAANAARERSRVQTLRHAFLELQRTLPSVPPDTKLSKLDVLLLATTYIAHLTRSLQDDAEAPAEPGLGALRGDGYLHPVKGLELVAHSHQYQESSCMMATGDAYMCNSSPQQQSQVLDITRCQTGQCQTQQHQETVSENQSGGQISKLTR